MKYWTTKTGEKLAIKDMETQHIENCIKMLERNMPESEEDYEEPYIIDLGDFDQEGWVTVPGAKKFRRKINAFKKELSRRIK